MISLFNFYAHPTECSTLLTRASIWWPSVAPVRFQQQAGWMVDGWWCSPSRPASNRSLTIPNHNNANENTLSQLILQVNKPYGKVSNCGESSQLQRPSPAAATTTSHHCHDQFIKLATKTNDETASATKTNDETASATTSTQHHHVVCARVAAGDGR